jgi:hypothetical protein
VWQTKGLLEGDFGCVAKKGVMGAFFGCVANAGVRGLKLEIGKLDSTPLPRMFL